MFFKQRPDEVASRRPLNLGNVKVMVPCTAEHVLESICTRANRDMVI